MQLLLTPHAQRAGTSCMIGEEGRSGARHPGQAVEADVVDPVEHLAHAAILQDGRVREVEVRDDGIRLGQLLKLAGLVDQGSDVRPLLEEGVVTVGGRLETRRGRQLKKGDVVAVRDEKVRLV